MTGDSRPLDSITFTVGNDFPNWENSGGVCTLADAIHIADINASGATAC